MLQSYSFYNRKFLKDDEILQKSKQILCIILLYGTILSEFSKVPNYFYNFSISAKTIYLAHYVYIC